MTRRTSITVLLSLLAMSATAAAQPYSAQREADLVRLADAKAQTTVAIVPSVGNIAVEMRVKGQNVLYWPFSTVDDFKARPAMSGIPFLGPWANRLDEQAFYANGRRYPFDMTLGNVRGAIPIHGFLTTTNQWQIVEMKSDGTGAWLTSRLEFYRQPAWMKQWPFAHTVEMTYRLQGGVLEVRTTITNMSADPMPVAIGFHPYYRLSDSVRDEWTIAVGARTRWTLTPQKVPTGQTEPIENLFTNPQAAKLVDHDLDDVFGDLVRDSEGRASASLMGKSQRLDILVGRNYRALVVWAPRPTQTAPERNFICFEPMAGITNAPNLAEKGIYKELQSIPPGGTWRESFWIKPSGF